MLSLEDLQLLPPNKWQHFESLCRELYRAEWGDFFAQKHGRPGHAQQGVDVFGSPKDTGGWAGVQCKTKDLLVRATLAENELRAEVKKARTFRPPLKQFIIATTAPRDPALQRLARQITERHRRLGLFSVHVHSWDDITDMLAHHPTVATRYYGAVLPANQSAQPLFRSAATTRLSPRGTRKQRGEGPTSLVLPRHTTHALALLAVNPFPLPEEALAQLFPPIHWAEELAVLQREKAITMTDGVFVVPPRTAAVFLGDAAEQASLRSEWIEALRPHSFHPDTALLLATHLLAAKAIPEAVKSLAVVAESLEPGSWNDIYSQTLVTLDTPKVQKALSAEDRLTYLHAVALCLSRGAEPEVALPWLARLRRESDGCATSWASGQAALLTGVVHHRAGNLLQAGEHLEQAVRNARAHRNYLQLGHALHNLAMLTAETDPHAARGLLEESIKAKERAGDEAGAVGSLLCRGLIEACEGNPRAARRWFDRAERAAEKTDQRHAQVIAVCNSATAAIELGNATVAKGLYQRAARIAEQEQDAQGLLLALTGEARALDDLGQFPEAEAIFRRLHTLHAQAGRGQEAVVALHDVAVMLLRQRKDPAARRIFRQALDRAREANIPEWIERCHRDLALSFDEVGAVSKALASLRKSATTEERARRFAVAATLWEDLAVLLQRRGGGLAAIEEAYLRASTALAKLPGACAQRCRLLRRLYGWRWASGEFEAALRALADLEQAAADGREREQRARALDQRGVCLQELGRIGEAVKAHRSALTIARRLPHTEVTEHCLSNLGEALRKLGETVEAIRCYRGAETLAQARRDEEGAIAKAHNRALALEDVGRYREATAVLRRCRDRALKLTLWDEYVRALHGLANHAWQRGDAQEAERQYRAAIREARRRRVSTQLCPLALNYANALRVKGQPRRALKVLRSVEESFERLPDAHTYLADLASVLSEAGERTESLQVWARARDHARRVGDTATAALASAAVASLLAEDEDIAAAEEELRRALERASAPGEQVSLLSQRLQLALKSGQERQAKRTFDRLLSLSQRHGLHVEAIGAHILVGDHAWDGDGNPANALKAYAAALVRAVELGLETMVQVGVHAVQRLLSLRGKDVLDRLDAQERSLEEWIGKKVTGADVAAVRRFLCWPLRLARRLHERRTAGGGLPGDRQISHMIYEELSVAADLREGGGKGRR